MAEKDAQLELKKRARRRLVGAVALALLAAIVVPMVMDQEPQPPNQDIQVRIPSRDSPFNVQVQPLQPALPHPPQTTAPPPAEKVLAPAEASDKEGSGPPAKGPNRPSEPPPHSKAPDRPTAAASVERHPAKAVPEPSVKPAENPMEKAAAKRDQAREGKLNARADEARARAILDATDQFVVQLGAFAEPANVRKVRARVKAEGYNSFVEPMRTAGGVKTRVRAGPFSSREAAEKARDKLKRGGLDGIVAPKS
ncbi:MAG: SPOR domain-containing protein [Hyphomicrobiaceae bacterium]